MTPQQHLLITPAEFTELANVHIDGISPARIFEITLAVNTRSRPARCNIMTCDKATDGCMEPRPAPSPEQYAELEKANQSLASEVMRLVVEQDKAAAQAREDILIKIIVFRYRERSDPRSYFESWLIEDKYLKSLLTEAER